jgi:hypothetical protein
MLAQLDLVLDNVGVQKVWLAWLFIACGVILILIGLGYAAYQQRLERITPAPLPGEIAGMPLHDRILGAAALNELSWMHGQEFQLNMGAVGSYGRGNEITLYVAGTPLSFLAGRMIINMQDKIDNTESPFTPLGQREDGSRRVYELVGMGRQHFYFRSGNLVVWLEVDEENADASLQQVLEFYP